MEKDKDERKKKALQSITAHCTALSSHHWHLEERRAEGEGWGKCVGRETFSVISPPRN